MNNKNIGRNWRWLIWTMSPLIAASDVLADCGWYGMMGPGPAYGFIYMLSVFLVAAIFFSLIFWVLYKIVLGDNNRKQRR